MKDRPVKILHLLLVAVLAVSLVAAEGSVETYTPPFEVGPSGGDQYNMVDAGEDGRIIAGRAYPVVSVLSCDARGGYALYELTHTATGQAPSVTVAYSDAAIDPYVFVTINVIDADGEFLGALHERGPLTGDGEFVIPLAWPEDAVDFESRDIRIQFGLEITSACPSVDAGTIKFDEVQVGA